MLKDPVKDFTFDVPQFETMAFTFLQTIANGGRDIRIGKIAQAVPQLVMQPVSGLFGHGHAVPSVTLTILSAG